MFPSGCFWQGADLLGQSPAQSRARWLHCASLAVSWTLGRVEQEKDLQDFGERKALQQPPLT